MKLGEKPATLSLLPLRFPQEVTRVMVSLNRQRNLLRVCLHSHGVQVRTFALNEPHTRLLTLLQ